MMDDIDSIKQRRLVAFGSVVLLVISGVLLLTNMTTARAASVNAGISLVIGIAVFVVNAWLLRREPRGKAFFAIVVVGLLNVVLAVWTFL